MDYTIIPFIGNAGRLPALGVTGYEPQGGSTIAGTDITMSMVIPGNGQLNKDIIINLVKAGYPDKKMKLATGTKISIPNNLAIILDDANQTIVAEGGRRKRTIKKRKLRRSTRKN